MMQQQTERSGVRWVPYTIIALATVASAAAGSLASISSQNFYTMLHRPPWAPPPSLFGPVWSVLYLMMAIAACLAWSGAIPWARARVMTLYGAQLMVNALWTWWFFRWHSGVGALVDILVLLVLIVATMVTFARVRSLAMLLLVPYFVWVSFATVLTIAMWQLNPGIL